MFYNTLWVKQVHKKVMHACATCFLIVLLKDSIFKSDEWTFQYFSVVCVNKVSFENFEMFLNMALKMESVVKTKKPTILSKFEMFFQSWKTHAVTKKLDFFAIN